MDVPILQSLSNSTTISSAKLSTEEKQSKEDFFWGDDGFTFGDLVDMFNPMHHIPVISKYYREQMHDDASEGSRLIGGVLFGGLMGGVAGILTSVANSAVRHETQHDMSEHVIELAEESFDNIAFIKTAATQSSKVSDLKPSADITNAIADIEEYNPFFLDVLEEDSNNVYLSDHRPGTRITDWGKV